MSEIVTLRLDEDELAEIDREVEERGYGSRAEYLRWIIRNRDAIKQNTADRLSEHEQRIATVEAALEELEEAVDEQERTDGREDSG